MGYSHLDRFGCFSNPVEYMKIKNFDKWTIVKKKIELNSSFVSAHDGTIWFCSVGENIGYEEDGKNANYERPVLVLRKWSQKCFLGVPLTRTLRNGSYFYTFEFESKNSCALLIQIRTFDFKRLSRLLGSIPDRQLYEIRKQLCSLIMKADPPTVGESSGAQQLALRPM